VDTRTPIRQDEMRPVSIVDKSVPPTATEF
jgi:hypothetical protein